jgi:L-alanine-DL-glutamate epimerase-like enolase superfamily enzyme
LPLPEVRWLEHSFPKFDHPVEKTLAIRDGLVEVPKAPGHGLVPSEAGRNSAQDLTV